MKCTNCPYFKILHMPLPDDDAIYYFGKAKCMKHNHIVDFGCKGKFQKGKQAESGCSSWDRDFEIVECKEIIDIKE